MDFQQIKTVVRMLEYQLTRGTLVVPLLTPRPRVFRDGDQYCALHGEDLQCGIAGFGDTPAQAVESYWEAFQTSDATHLAALNVAQGGGDGE